MAHLPDEWWTVAGSDSAQYGGSLFKTEGVHIKDSLHQYSSCVPQHCVNLHKGPQDSLCLIDSPAKRRNFCVSGGRLEEMCIEEGSLEKKGSREEGVAGVSGAGDRGGGSSLMCDSWLSRVSRTGGLLSRSVACTRKKASTAGCSTTAEQRIVSTKGFPYF